MSKKGNYVSRKEAKKMREEMPGIIENVRKDFREKHSYSFSTSIVGSAKRNMIIQFGNSKYDTDYQLVFSSKKHCSKIDASIKKEILDLFRKYIPQDWGIQNSKSVITIIKIENKKEIHSFDIAVIRTKNEESEKSFFDKNDNKYKWNQIGKLSQAYINFKNDYETIGEIVKEKYLVKRQKTPWWHKWW